MRYRHTMLLVYISLPICAVLRLLQMYFTIDNTRGFIKQQYSLIGVLITVIIFSAVGAISLLAATTDGIKQKNTTLRPGVAVASMLAGGMFIYQTVANVMLFATGVWYNGLFVVLSFFTALVLIAYGIKNIYDYKFPQILTVVPVVYYIVKLINVFINTSKLALVTENVFLIFTNSAILLFVFELASFENEIGEMQKRPKKLFAYGVATIMLCVTTSLPKLAMILFTENQYLHADVAETCVNLSVAIFVLLYIMYNYGEGTKHFKKAPPKHLV